MFVQSSLNHNNQPYERGDKIDTKTWAEGFTAEQKARLVELGVVGPTDPTSAPEPAATDASG